MAVDTVTLRPRRAVLAAALGGLAASIAGAVARPELVRAGADGDVVLGVANVSPNATTIQSTSAFAFGATGSAYGVTAYGGTSGLKGESNPGYGVMGVGHTSYGVYGVSTSSTGVYGETTSGTGVVGTSGASIGVSGTSPSGTGVSGSSGSGVGVHAFSNAANRPAGQGWSAGDSTGLQGYSGSDSPPAAPAKTGVFGYAAQDADARGVHGRTTNGRGVFGEATTGAALYGSTASPKTGFALRTVGRVRFEKSVGISTVPSGTNHVTVTPGVDITTSSAVVATLQGSAGGKTTVQRVALNATADTFTIYLTANATASVKVAWHVFG